MIWHVENNKMCTLSLSADERIRAIAPGALVLLPLAPDRLRGPPIPEQ